jgi:hypothetical protein
VNVVLPLRRARTSVCSGRAAWPCTPDADVDEALEVFGVVGEKTGMLAATRLERR